MSLGFGSFEIGFMEIAKRNMNEIKEKPILFSPSMVRAILEGRKSQTRRVIKPQPIEVFQWGYNSPPTLYKLGKPPKEIPQAVVKIPIRCPYEIGSKLWVRETFCIDNNRRIYKADFPTTGGASGATLKWKPSIFMPREASRIALEITNVRVERIQGISEMDAVAEGVQPSKGDCSYRFSPITSEPQETFENCSCCENATDIFKRLWDSINAKRGFSFEQNPFVWVIDFKQIITKI